MGQKDEAKVGAYLWEKAREEMKEGGRGRGDGQSRMELWSDMFM